MESFSSNDSAIKIVGKNSLISNGYYPIFTAGNFVLEIINWTTAANPRFCIIHNLPEKDSLGYNPKIALFNNNTILVYNVLSGLVNITNFSNIHYITKCNTSTSLFSYFQPQIIDKYIFTIEHISHFEGISYYLVIREICEDSETENNSNLWKLSFLVLIPVVIISLILLMKSKR